MFLLKIAYHQPNPLHLQPHNTQNNPIVIAFDGIIAALAELNDETAERFVKSLRRWKGECE